VHASNSPPLPFGLEPIGFPFPAIAALAGRLPHGGGREVALAALTCARLATGAVGLQAIAPADRVVRANSAKIWLASIALPPHTRMPLAKCIEASTGSPAAIVTSLRAVVAAATAHLDGAAVEELERLARRITAAG